MDIFLGLGEEVWMCGCVCGGGGGGGGGLSTKLNFFGQFI